MTLTRFSKFWKQAAVVGCGGLLLSTTPVVFAQDAPPPQEQDQQQAPAQLSPDQLDNLVAPIALYPDSLLSQVLVASTYPLEVVELSQFLQQNRNLQGQDLINAVKQQNWDPSVQAMAAFPDVVARLNQDVRWTTDLGNAFLAQQADVMNAVQRMRARAQQAGRLNSNEQETVVTQNQGGQPAIEIQPADPQVVYVPVYNPAYIWGPPVYGYYPPLYYPGIGVGFSFLPGVRIGLFFGDCCGWGGWGWGPNWYGRTVIVNNTFIHRYGFSDYHGASGFRSQGVWSHNPEHRLGVPYANRGVASQFANRGGEYRNAAPAARGGESFYNSRGSAPAQTRQDSRGGANFGTPAFENRNSGESRSAFGGTQSGGRARTESDHGFSSGGGGSRGGSAPASHAAPSHGGGRR
jgi:uncharacterized membrane protein YgcG